MCKCKAIEGNKGDSQQIVGNLGIGNLMKEYLGITRTTKILEAFLWPEDKIIFLAEVRIMSDWLRLVSFTVPNGLPFLEII